MNRLLGSCRRRVSVLAAGALLAASGVVVGAAYPAAVAPPGNDSLDEALPISGIPTRVVQDTREATPSRDDGECVYGDSVWYRFRPTTTTTARVVTVGSDFDTVLAVFRGRRADRTLVACNDDGAGLNSAAEVRFRAGARYWIAVSACCGRRGVGGHSVLTLYRPRPAATSMSLGPVTTGAVSGRIFASGTVRCDTPSVAAVTVTVSQRVGTQVARGSGVSEMPLCSSAGRSWDVQVDSETGVAFQEGLASVTVRVDSLDGFAFAEQERTANVTVGSSPNRTGGDQAPTGPP